jgi:hypothetical protein
MSEPTPTQLLETVLKAVLRDHDLTPEDREALEKAVFIAKALQKKKPKVKP